MSEPVVVLYKSAQCPACTTLTGIWERVVTALKVVNPRLRFFVVTTPDRSGRFDENTAPKSLIRYNKWYPTVLLVPGKLWDAAMASLGPRNPVDLKDGVQIMNGVLVKDVPTIVNKYDPRKPEEFVRWYKDASSDPDFIRVSLAGVPEVPSQSIPVSPLVTGIARPGNTVASYVPVGGQSTSVCSMRIIARPK